MTDGSRQQAYPANVSAFLTHRHITWREALDGSSFVGAALVVLAAGALVLWRRHLRR